MYVAGPGVEPATSDFLVRRITDCARRPGFGKGTFIISHDKINSLKGLLVFGGSVALINLFSGTAARLADWK